jgi:aryl-alcohol dehydrogenase-like predicted oxidoreductase
MDTHAGFTPRVLGRTGLSVFPLGISATYGVPTEAVERAVEAGVNYLYWGSLRRRAFGQALRNVARQRDRLLIVLQSYSPFATGVTRAVERGLRRLGLDRADILLLGAWNRRVPPRILDQCEELKKRGLVRVVGLSTHRRTLVPKLARGGSLDVFHVRYNAVHPGAERDIFPHLSRETGPGIISFTATSWKQLLGHRRIPAGERIPDAGDCYRFALSHPSVHVCMTGPATAAHVDHALAAIEKGPMDEKELAWMRRVGAAIYGAR